VPHSPGGRSSIYSDPNLAKEEPASFVVTTVVSRLEGMKVEEST
jgi:hypothetical protein